MSITSVVGWSHALLSRPRRRPIDLVAALVAALVFALPVSNARAADVPPPPAKPKEPTAPPYNWGGCYFGFNAGGGGSGSNFTAVVADGTHLAPADAILVGTDGSGSANASNWLAGGQAGCNWQAQTLVFGIEGDVDYFRSNPQFINATNTLTDGVTTFTATQSLTTDYLATLRPRFGVAADRNLGYLTAGVAFTKVNYTLSYVDAAVPSGTGLATGTKSMLGWTAGAGWEYAWKDNVTVRVEYLFAKFGTTSVAGAITDTGGGANPLRGSADITMQIARVGMNFKF